MAPHLLRAQSVYKDIRIHSFHHSHTHTRARAPRCTYTHTHYKYMYYWWWIGKTTDQYAEKKRWVFSFDFRNASWFVPEIKMEWVPNGTSNVGKRANRDRGKGRRWTDRRMNKQTDRQDKQAGRQKSRQDENLEGCSTSGFSRTWTSHCPGVASPGKRRRMRVTAISSSSTADISSLSFTHRARSCCTQVTGTWHVNNN